MKKPKNVTTGEDLCVVCNKPTEFPQNMSIYPNEKEKYVESAGSLCATCYATIYGAPYMKKTEKSE